MSGSTRFSRQTVFGLAAALLCSVTTAQSGSTPKSKPVPATAGAAGAPETKAPATGPGSAGPASTAKAAAQPVEFRIAASYIDDQSPAGLAQQQLMAQLRELSGSSSMSVSLLPAGTVVTNDKLLNAVANGSVEAAWADPAVWADKDPAFTLFSGVPYSMTPARTLGWMASGGGGRLFKELHDKYNVEALVCGVFRPASGLWTRQPLGDGTAPGGLGEMSVAVSVAGSPAAALLSGVGAVPRLVNPAELRRSMELDVLGAAYLPDLALASQLELFAGVAAAWYPAGVEQQASLRALIVSRQFWETMSSSQRDAVTAACDTLTLKTLARSEAALADSVPQVKDKQVAVHRLPAGLVLEMRKAWLAHAADLAGQSELFKAGWESMRSFAARQTAFDAFMQPGVR